MPEVRRVGFELTDVTTDGMKIVAQFPNMRELTLYGGMPGIDDEGLSTLRGNENIETLKLINCDVTDMGLNALESLPKLRSLTLYRDGFRAKTITDQGLLSLKTLKNLELTVDGGWASDAAVRQLQAELPSCRITTESEWNAL